MRSKRKISDASSEPAASWSSGDSSTPSPDSRTTASSDDYMYKHPATRRQGWRNCARARRAAEAGAFQDLALSLPLPRSELRELDKIGVLRVAVCYGKLKRFVEQIGVKMESGESLLGSLDVGALLGQNSLLIVMATDGEIVYVSENPSNFLHREKPLATSIFDHIHCEDRSKVQRLLQSPHRIQQLSNNVLEGAANSATVRLASGAVVKVTGKLFLTRTGSFFVGFVQQQQQLLHPQDNGYPLQHPHFSVLVSYDFVCTLDMKMFYAGSKAQQHLGYSIPELLGLSGYEMAHPDSAEAFEEFGRLCSSEEGSHQSRCYQVLVKGGGWAWFVTQGAKKRVEIKDTDGTVRTITYLAGRDYMISEVFERDKVVGAIQVDAWGMKNKLLEEKTDGCWWEEALGSGDYKEEDEYLDEMLRMLDGDEDFVGVSSNQQTITQ